ncbi:Calcineurin subunit B type 2 [Nosema granulosis]|uniref:Calcineurin subunit B type 2 n=1 Tax=Nosema granulosis TaxID=83296 RepID=A0A9P6GYM8_9MICR|nr:Calcineurin subunit B type 2 [Nosema granulosis]
MGNINSAILCEEEIEAIKSTTVFEYAEIEHLFERFLYLDKMNYGYLTYNELNNIPEFEINPFNKLIINALEKKMDYENISFPCFLSFLEIFHRKTDKIIRIQFLFDIFDLNRDGRLCKSVLNRICMLMGKSGHGEAEYVLEIFDRNNKGFLDMNDFIFFYDSDPNIEKNMVIDYSKNIKQPQKVGFLDIIVPSWSKKSE